MTSSAKQRKIQIEFCSGSIIRPRWRKEELGDDKMFGFDATYTLSTRNLVIEMSKLGEVVTTITSFRISCSGSRVKHKVKGGRIWFKKRSILDSDYELVLAYKFEDSRGTTKICSKYYFDVSSSSDNQIEKYLSSRYH